MSRIVVLICSLLAFTAFAGERPRATASTPTAAHSAAKYAETVASLIDPAKLAMLGKRAANPRVQKVVYWLSTAASNGVPAGTVMDQALAKLKITEAAGLLTKQALLRNLDIAAKLGCLDADGLTEMRQGKAPTVRKGPYKGDQLSVDHIIPFAVCPELDHVMANLELMPLRMNESKNAAIGQRQRDLARKLHTAGLLRAEGLKRIQ